jgi:hypothetical protein
VLGLTVGDYLLWNWSLNAGHEVLALASGLTLPPLVLLSLWTLALIVMRAVAALAGVSRRARSRRAARTARPASAAGRARTAQARPGVTASAAGPSAGSGEGSRRIAA